MAAFILTAITSDPGLAGRADAAGVDRVGVDIERLNKRARQGDVNARISDHELSDLDRLAATVTRAALFARLNPLHEGSRDEVEEALDRGATVLMLPFFNTPQEVDRFVGLVKDRALIVLLLETSAALVRLHDILAVPGVDEVLVGLNDLHRSMGVANHFEVLASDLMTMVSDQVRGTGLRFGFGGLARVGDRDLPVPAELVFAQTARLKSTSSWLSRSFFSKTAPDELDQEVMQLRQRLAYWAAQPEAVLCAQHEALRRHLLSLGQP
jgi:hypothetical protein